MPKRFFRTVIHLIIIGTLLYLGNWAYDWIIFRYVNMFPY